MSKNKKDTRHISDVLRHCRHTRRLSQAELAGRLGVEQSYISLLESGKRTPSILMLIRIAEAMSVSVGALIESVAAEWRPRCRPGGAASAPPGKIFPSGLV